MLGVVEGYGKERSVKGKQGPLAKPVKGTEAKPCGGRGRGYDGRDRGLS